MSEFHVKIVKLGKFEHHPNADTLDITKVFDYTVITKRGEYSEGDLAVYVPIDSIFPDEQIWKQFVPRKQDGTERFPTGSIPEKYRIIDAKKIRGIFSQGCLMKPPPGNWSEGDDVREVMNITKYEPPIPAILGGECEKPPTEGWIFPTYTDIEGMRRYPNILNVGEEVVLTEKIHGMNSRYVHDGNRLWVGSHHQIKRREKNVLWNIAEELVFVPELQKDVSLEEALSLEPWNVFFGEVFGQIQDLKYDIKQGAKFKVFDVFSIKDMKYLNHDKAVAKATRCGLEWVPILHRGPWDPEKLNDLCEGQSTFASNIREGFVVKPIIERWNYHIGRVILKRIGETYMLRKKK